MPLESPAGVRARRAFGSVFAALVLLAALPDFVVHAQAPPPPPARRSAPAPRVAPPRERAGPSPAARAAAPARDPLRTAVNGGVIAVLAVCLVITLLRRGRGEVPRWHVTTAFCVAVAGTMSSLAGLLGTDRGAGRALFFLSLPAWAVCLGYFVVARRAAQKAEAAAIAARRRQARR